MLFNRIYSGTLTHLAQLDVLVDRMWLQYQDKGNTTQGIVYFLLAVGLICAAIWLLVPFHKIGWIEKLVTETQAASVPPLPFPKDERQRLVWESNSGIQLSWTYRVPASDNLEVMGHHLTPDYGANLAYAMPPPPPPPPPHVVVKPIFSTFIGFTIQV